MKEKMKALMILKIKIKSILKKIKMVQNFRMTSKLAANPKTIHRKDMITSNIKYKSVLMTNPTNK